MAEKGNREKLFIEKVLKRIHPAPESDIEYDGDGDTENSQENPPLKHYTVLPPPPGINLTDLIVEKKHKDIDHSDTASSSSDSEKDSIQARKRRRRKRRAPQPDSDDKKQTEQLDQKEERHEPAEVFSKNKKRKLKKKRRKATLQQKSYPSTFVYEHQE
ncbi:G patch domain-containing protein 4-like [Liolophura sinensis]|uniref:G patch domain-containing protein 4-like n=1 Tax=Liolophura sinensis TaxID=3198878 RepID=UPI00315803A8